MLIRWYLWDTLLVFIGQTIVIYRKIYIYNYWISYQYLGFVDNIYVFIKNVY